MGGGGGKTANLSTQKRMDSARFILFSSLRHLYWISKLLTTLNMSTFVGHYTPQLCSCSWGVCFGTFEVGLTLQMTYTSHFWSKGTQILQKYERDYYCPNPSIVSPKSIMDPIRRDQTITQVVPKEFSQSRSFVQPIYRFSSTISIEKSPWFLISSQFFSWLVLPVWTGPG